MITIHLISLGYSPQHKGLTLFLLANISSFNELLLVTGSQPPSTSCYPCFFLIMTICLFFQPVSLPFPSLIYTKCLDPENMPAMMHLKRIPNLQSMQSLCVPAAVNMCLWLPNVAIFVMQMSVVYYLERSHLVTFLM